ncbi:t-SNARE [Suillus subalutaceus]|uniref:t-SNARE n=1 Tax=Suillus subalutaceus TaxID=48586 RepID=UPI001B85E74C|nr:t-SNARE [Suillus subalutaceus]KAG1878126.1 t-SNARE [Suillus subalutaceus]
MSTASSSTTRSRTLLFISFRDSRAPSTRFSRLQSSYSDEPYRAEDENETLIHPTSAPDSELPPKWVDLSEQVEEILGGTQAKSVHVLPGFADRTAEEREIEAATTEITKDFRRCHTLIQRIATEQGHSFPPSTQRTQFQVLAAKNVQRGLGREGLQGHAIKNQDLLIASGTISSRGSEGLTAVDEDVEAAQAQILDNIQDHDLRVRDRELTEIANSIASLAELFKDLSVLVIDQGTLLDSIEYNIEQTSVEMAEAVKELNHATRYQKNTGRRKLIFLLLLIIFGLIVVLIFKPRRSSSLGSPPTQDSMTSTDTLVSRYFHARTPPSLYVPNNT